MSLEELFIYAIPVTLFAAAAWLSHFCGKRRIKGGLLAIGGVCVVFSLMMYSGMEQARGLDGLGYLLGLIGIGAPVAAGGLIGGLIGWAGSNRQPAV